MKTKCPHCDATSDVEDQFDGVDAECPACHYSFKITRLPAAKLTLVKEGAANAPSAMNKLTIVQQAKAPTQDFTDYTAVPWARREGSLNIFTAIGLATWLLGGGPLAFVVLLFPNIMILSGDVYSKKKNPDGTLQKWNWNWKLGPIFLASLILIINIIF